MKKFSEGLGYEAGGRCSKSRIGRKVVEQWVVIVITLIQIVVKLENLFFGIKNIKYRYKKFLL